MNTALTFLLWFVVGAVGIWILIALTYLAVFTAVGRSFTKAFDKPLKLDVDEPFYFPKIERRTVRGGIA